MKYLDVYKQLSRGSLTSIPEFVHLTPVKPNPTVKNKTTTKSKSVTMKSHSNAETSSKIAANMKIKWQIGDRIKHKKWGEGIVIGINGTGQACEIKVKFLEKGIGIKSLLLKLAPIDKVAE